MTDETDPRDVLATRDVKPIVPLPRARLTGFGIALACGVFGLGLFSVLDAKRRSPSDPQSDQPVKQGTIASPPTLTIPQADTPIAAAPQEMTSADPLPQPPQRQLPPPAPPPMPYSAMTSYAGPPPMPVASPPASTRQTRWGVPSDADMLLLMDSGPGAARVPNEAKASNGQPAGEPAAGDEQAVRATIIRNRSSLVSQGTMIAAVLETPINSSRAGLARAIVTSDVRGFDGTRILIPRGSRLIGEARGEAQAGQKRVFVNWTRLIRPDGVAIRIGSPAADSLGGAGIKGSVNNHVLGRFGNAILQSALSIGINRASRSAGDSVVVGVPAEAGDAITQVPVFSVPTAPTINVPQGAEISIFVAKDLDFGGSGGRQ